jgi:hypothetical protein
MIRIVHACNVLVMREHYFDQTQRHLYFTTLMVPDYLVRGVLWCGVVWWPDASSLNVLMLDGAVCLFRFVLFVCFVVSVGFVALFVAVCCAFCVFRVYSACFHPFRQ